NSMTNINKSDDDQNNNNNKVKQVTSRKKNEFAGLSKVLVSLNNLSNLLITQDGIVWNEVNAFNNWISVGNRLPDFVTGFKLQNRAEFVESEQLLVMKRLYFVFNHNNFTTDVNELLLSLSKASLSVFNNVNNSAIS